MSGKGLSTEETWLQLPSSRDEARERGINRFFTGKPCNHGHLAPRYVSTNRCVQCQLDSSQLSGGWKARPSKEESLAIVRELVTRRDGVLLSTEYVSAKSKVKVRCPQLHEFWITPDDLKHGRWCPECKHGNHRKRMAAKLRTVEELREFVRRKHGGDCLATEPVSMHTRVQWKCANPDHEPFSATVAHVVHGGTWCPACDANRRRLHPPKPQISMEVIQSQIEERGGEIVQILETVFEKG